MADLLGVNPRLRRSLLATWAIAKPQWMCEMSRYDCEALIRKSSEPRPHKLSIEFLAEWKMLILDSISSSSLLLWHGANTHRRALLNLLFSWSIFLSMEKNTSCGRFKWMNKNEKLLLKLCQSEQAHACLETIFFHFFYRKTMIKLTHKLRCSQTFWRFFFRCHRTNGWLFRDVNSMSNWIDESRIRSEWFV